MYHYLAVRTLGNTRYNEAFHENRDQVRTCERRKLRARFVVLTFRDLPKTAEDRAADESDLNVTVVST